MNKTTWVSSKELEHKWYEIDATGMPLGRLAVTIAKHLMGKNTSKYVPNLDMGHFVIVTNAASVKLTGLKASYLDIRHYTGYPSGLRKEKVSNLLVKNPAKIIETAVKGMLPDSKMKNIFMSRLHVYAQADHTHAAQQPTKITL